MGCFLDRRREAGVERVGHSYAPVTAAVQPDEVSGDRERHHIGNAASIPELRLAPVPDRVEPPCPETFEGHVPPRFTPIRPVSSLEIGGVEVKPAAVVEPPARVCRESGLGASEAAVALPKVIVRGFLWSREVLEHELPALDVRRADTGSDRVHSHREEPVALRRHQPPTAVHVFDAEEAACPERWRRGHSPEAITRRQSRGPLFRPSHFCCPLCLEVSRRRWLLRPALAAVLTVAVDDPTIGVLALRGPLDETDIPEDQPPRLGRARHDEPEGGNPP